MKSSVINHTDESNANIKNKKTSYDHDDYGHKNGFYFQQRRGRLDLKQIASLDLDRIVRDVDIDILQIHLENITFCNVREEDLRFMTDQHVIKLFRLSQLLIEYLLYVQDQLAGNLNKLASKYISQKKSLYKKRRELVELKETSKVLHTQLKAKKNSLHVLEGLLKDSSRRPGSKSIHADDVAEPIEISQKRNQVRQQLSTDLDNTSSNVLKFFICCADGLCIEFNHPLDTYIREIKREFKNVLTTSSSAIRVGSNNISRNGIDMLSIKMMYQGRMLLDDSNLSTCNIRFGDTIIALFERSGGIATAASELTGRDETVLKKSTEEESKRTADLQLEEIKRQQGLIQAMANEMRQGWEASLAAITAQLQHKSQAMEQERMAPDVVFRKMEDKLASMEQQMRQQLDSQLLHYEQVLLKQQGLQRTSRRKYAVGDLESDEDDQNAEIDRKVRSSTAKLSTLERELAAQASRSEAMMRDMQDTLRAQETEMERLRATLSAAAAAEPRVIYIQAPAPVTGTQVTSTASAAPAMATTELARASEVPILEPEEVVEKAAAVEPLETYHSPMQEVVDPVTSPVIVTFTAVAGVRGQSGVGISLDRNDKADDVVLQLRQSLSKSMAVPLQDTVLSLDGLPVYNGTDVPEEFDAIMAQEAVSTGRMKAVLNRPISDAQVDALVSEWENRSEDEGIGRTRPEETMRKSQILRQSGGLLSNGLDRNPESSSSRWRSEVEATLSLEGGLSDELYKKKIDELRQSSSGLINDIEMYRQSIAGAVANAVTVEDFFENDDDSDDNIYLEKNLLRLSLESMRKSYGRLPLYDDDMIMFGSKDLSKKPIRDIMKSDDRKLSLYDSMQDNLPHGRARSRYSDDADDASDYQVSNKPPVAVQSYSQHAASESVSKSLPDRATVGDIKPFSDGSKPVSNRTPPTGRFSPSPSPGRRFSKSMESPGRSPAQSLLALSPYSENESLAFSDDEHDVPFAKIR